MTTEQFLSAQVTQLAALTKIPKDTWMQYLYKGRNPGSRFLKKAARALDMTIDDLITAMETRQEQIQHERQIRAEVSELIEAAS